MDSGSDIAIMGKDLLKRVAAAAKLTKNRLKKVDKVPKTYDGRPFTLHGRMDLDITFEDTTMRTPVYIKLDTTEPLLLSEGVCRQLRILSYHPSVIKQTGKFHPRVGAYGDNSREVQQYPATPAGDQRDSIEYINQSCGQDPEDTHRLSGSSTKHRPQSPAAPVTTR